MADADGQPDAIALMVNFLRDKARKDPALREVLRAAAKVLLSAAAEGEAQPAAPAAATQAPPPPAPAPTPPAPARAMPGRDAPGPPVPSPVRPTVSIPYPPPVVPAGPVVQTRLRLGDAVRAVAVTGTPEEARAAAEIADRSAAMRRPPQAEPLHPPHSQHIQYSGPPAHAGHQSSPPDLSLVVRRCRVKAAGCRYVIERPRMLAAAADAAQAKDRELYTQAKSLPDCYLWMMAPHGPVLPPDEELRELAENYEVLAQAAEMMSAVATAETSREPGDPWSDSWFEEAMRLLAEAQSGLRVGLSHADRTLTDYDQNEAFQWLRWYSRERQIYISRHMRLDDGADPAEWDDLRQRIAAFRQNVEGRQQRDRARKQLVNKARYHAQRVNGPDGAVSTDDWVKLLAAVEELVAKGVPPSDVDLREVLRPLMDQMPEDLQIGPGVEKVLREIDRYLSSVAGDDGQAEREREKRESPEVRRAAELLAGRRVVLIGGACRPFAKQALERTLGLSELDWISTSPHESVSTFEPSVARPDTALVLLAIRWSSHSFGEVKALADHYGKAFVRLPAGYNPQQVAAQVLAQASGALEALGPSGSRGGMAVTSSNGK